MKFVKSTPGVCPGTSTHTWKGKLGNKFGILSIPRTTEMSYMRLYKMLSFRTIRFSIPSSMRITNSALSLYKEKQCYFCQLYEKGSKDKFILPHSSSTSLIKLLHKKNFNIVQNCQWTFHNRYCCRYSNNKRAPISQENYIIFSWTVSSIRVYFDYSETWKWFYFLKKFY